ncbi:5086_t:CDS:1, partial [Entrophospora sp. SA101]
EEMDNLGNREGEENIDNVKEANEETRHFFCRIYIEDWFRYYFSFPISMG